MKKKDEKLYLSLTVIIIFIIFYMVSCGGNVENNPGVSLNIPTINQTGTPPPDTGSVKIQIAWPEDDKDIKDKVIQPQVIKIEISMTGTGLTEPRVETIFKGVTTTTVNGLPVGDKAFEFQGRDSSDKLISHRITNVTIIKNQTVLVPAHMGVTILNSGFSPSSIPLNIGDKLYWVNNDNVVHNVVADNTSFQSGDIPPGGEFAFTFNSYGTITYKCTKTGMTGAVVLPTATPQPSGPTATPTYAGPTPRNFNYSNQLGSFGGLYCINSGNGVALDTSGNIYLTDTINNCIKKFNTSGTLLNTWGSYGTGNGQFNLPKCIAIDGSDNIYVSDSGNHRIQKFNTSGVYQTKWGSQGFNDGQFSTPYGIAFDSSGNVYVVDCNNYRIQKFNASGVYQTKWGGFDLPRGIGFDSSGNIYVADTNNQCIKKFNSTGGYLLQWGIAGGGNGEFSFPGLMAIDGTDNIYVTDGGNNRIQKFDTTGGYLDKWGIAGGGNGQFRDPYSIAVTPGAIYVTDFYARVQQFDSTTTPPSYQSSWYWSDYPANGKFNQPGAIAIDGSNNIYVYDRLNYRIQKFNASGVYQSQWGRYGTGNGEFFYSFGQLKGIAFDSSGNIYVTDGGNNRIQKFDTTGGYQSQWGTSGSGNGQFNDPQGIAVDSAGNIYVVDKGNYRIQKFNSSLAYQSKWGSSGSGNSQFNNPHGIALDSSGYIYISDSGNNRIQKFNSSGVYQSQWGIAGTANGNFNYPTGIVLDTSGNIYVADTNNNRIQIFYPNGTYQSKWGSSGTGNGQFSSPKGITFDTSGNIYVVDGNNNRIQKFIPAP